MEKQKTRKRGDNLVRAREIIVQIIEEAKERGFYGLNWSIKVGGRKGEYLSPWPGTLTIMAIGNDGALLYEREEDLLVVVESIVIGNTSPDDLSSPRLYERIKAELAHSGLLAPDRT